MNLKFPTIENESQYIQSMLELIDSVPQGDRTGTGTTKMFNQEFHFSLENENLPVLIGKHTGLKTALVELVWIMKGRNDLEWLKKHGVNYWDEWVKEDGTFGPIYGPQMRNFAGMQVDQLLNVVDMLINNFDSRRNIISLWDPTTMKDQALPCCHCFYHITTYRDVNARKMFNLHVTQRSGDSYLGVPYDLLMFMYFMKIIELSANVQLGQYDFINPSELFLTVNDYHLYSNHHDAVRKYAENYVNTRYVHEENSVDFKGCFNKPPQTIKFKKSFDEKCFAEKLNINEILDLIVEYNFDVFEFYGYNREVEWKLPKNTPKIKADVAV